MPERTVRKEEIKKQYAEIFARQSIGYLLKRVVIIMTCRLNAAFSPHGITLANWVVLSCLWQEDGLPVMYIARQIQHIGGTLSDLLSRMEKRQLIRRRRDRLDKRIWRVYLTEKGKEFSTVLPPLVHQEWCEVWKTMSPEKLEEFSRILDHMIHNFEPEYAVHLPAESPLVAKEHHVILPPRSVGYRVKVLLLLLTRRFTDAIEVHNVTPSHWVVLCSLWQGDGVPVNEIGQYLEQIGGSLTGVLERMEERGLITRQKDTRDRRSSRVWLTAEGEALIEVLPPIAQTCLDAVGKGLSEAEVAFSKDCLREMLLCTMDKD